MPTEIITVTAAILLTALILALLIRAGRTQAARARTPASPPARTLTRDQLDTQLHTLINQQRPIHAIKLLREQTGMGLKEAKNAVDGLAAGRPITHPAYTALGPPTPDLATRARELKQTGRTDQAVHLVRDETGMTEDDATRFVDAL